MIIADFAANSLWQALSAFDFSYADKELPEELTAVSQKSTPYFNLWWG
jgi:hypothetical protein